MKLSWPITSLRGKFNLFIIVGILLWLANFPVIYNEINKINRNIVNLELMEDLYNTILEMRRYEKNYLLYQRADNLKEVTNYLNLARETLRNASLKTTISERRLARLKADIEGYDAIIKTVVDRQPEPLLEDLENKIRSVGKEMVEIAERLLKLERARMAETAKNASRWPLIFLGLMFLLFMTGVTMVTRKVINPLGELEKATEKIARGDFSVIPHNGKIESQVDRLIAAFNRMTRELEAWEEQSIHSRKIASLGTLVSGIAHELNNPINNIILTIDTLVGKKSMPDERRELLLDDILKQALRASAIVKNLLDFSRAETSSYTELDLAILLRETIKITGHQISLAQVRLHDQIANNLPPVVGNHQGLQQVFVNLIVNAIQAMPEGGDLIIQANEQDNKIVIRVQDTGQGIPDDILPSIFDPFFTTKEVGQGTGLGLSVSYGVIKKHGGQILVQSKLGQGTAFTVELPIRR